MRYQELQLSTNNAEVFLDNMHLTSLHISSRLPSLSAKIFWNAPWQSRLPHPQVILSGIWPIGFIWAASTNQKTVQNFGMCARSSACRVRLSFGKLSRDHRERESPVFDSQFCPCLYCLRWIWKDWRRFCGFFLLWKLYFQVCNRFLFAYACYDTKTLRIFGICSFTRAKYPRVEHTFH